MDSKIRKNIYKASFVSILCALIISGCGSKDRSAENTEIYTETIYEPHEHTISIPIEKDEDYTSDVVQYDSYLGYRPIAFSFESYGRSQGHIGDLNIVFTNECEVKSRYGEIGEPIEPLENKYETRVFDSYQHILSVPLDENDCYEDVKQYPYHEGYELVGMDTVTWGRTVAHNTKEVLLYVNTCPVEVINCIIEDGKLKSVEFGSPISLEKNSEKAKQKVKKTSYIDD